MSHFAPPNCYSESNSGECAREGCCLFTFHGVISSRKHCYAWNFDLSGWPYIRSQSCFPYAYDREFIGGKYLKKGRTKSFTGRNLSRVEIWIIRQALLFLGMQRFLHKIHEAKARILGDLSGCHSCTINILWKNTGELPKIVPGLARWML